MYNVVKKMIPQYKGRTVFQKSFWRMFWDRCTKGFDESDTWSLDYTITKFISPRLKEFMKYANIAVPISLLRAEYEKSVSKGFKMDKYFRKLTNERENKRCLQRAQKQWMSILKTISQGLDDEILEEENYTLWLSKWETEVSKYQNKLKKAAGSIEKRIEILKALNYETSVNGEALVITAEIVSNNLRKKARKLLMEYYNDLWW